MINRKGIVLPVTVVAMVIMMIIGLVSLKMFQIRSIFMAENILKSRVFYSAEGCVELMRASIDLRNRAACDATGYSANKDGYLATLFPEGMGPQYILEVGGVHNIFAANKSFEEVVDSGGHISSPKVSCRVYGEGLLNNTTTVSTYSKYRIDFPTRLGTVEGAQEYRFYRIVSEASATYRSSLGNKDISVKIEYYFFTKLTVDIFGRYRHKIYFAGWRKI